MTNRLKLLLGIMILMGGIAVWSHWYDNHKITVKTAHYSINSSANMLQTTHIGEAAESLYSAYIDFFSNTIPVIKKHHTLLKMNLYGNKYEFTAINRSSSWAEAFYQEPFCYAYYPEGESNPYHWMIHEGTHQLNNEVSHFKLLPWIDEGLATYFSASKIVSGKLLPGQIALDAYPIYWLSTLSLTGNISIDISKGKIIPLRSLIKGTGGPDINRHFNLYYIHYWSLTHFLFNYKDGKYSAGYRKLISEGGSLNGFEKLIGPADTVQEEWYQYLQQIIAEVHTMRS